MFNSDSRTDIRKYTIFCNWYNYFSANVSDFYTYFTAKIKNFEPH